MFLNKMNRLATNCGNVKAAATRSIVSVGSLRGPNDVVRVNNKGYVVDDGELSLKEQARLTRLLTPKIGHIRIQLLNPNNRLLALFVYEFTKFHGHPPPPQFYDQQAAGIGAFYAIKALLAKHDKSVGDVTFAIQGFENVGGHIALCVHRAGGKIVGVSDKTGAVKNKEGIDMNALFKHYKGGQNCLADSRGGGSDFSMDADELLASECHVLIPLAKALNRKNAADVKAKFVVENAMIYPTYRDSDEILSKKGVVILDQSSAADDSSGDEDVRESYVQNAFNRLIRGWARKSIESIRRHKKKT